jgi:hypothetical protein
MPHVSSVVQRSFSRTLSTLLTLALGLGLTAGLVAADPTHVGRLPAHRLVAEDDEVVLPGRVATAINRTLRSADRAEGAIDDDRRLDALAALSAVAENLRRSARAALAEISAVPVDEEAEGTPGPDSAVAVLNLDQSVLNQLSGFYDNLRRPAVVWQVRVAMRVAHNQRVRLLNTVIALDPEGAGADYADGMADTVDGYADEIAGLTEALRTDRLIASARVGLQNARSRAVSTQAKVTTAFGGGE